VIATRGTIAELRKKQDEELARVRKGEAATGSLASSLKANPVYQGLEMELKRTQVLIAEQRQELAMRNARVAELRGRVNTVPEVEAELARLNRDYEVNRQRYQELVQRRETASLSENADRSGTVKFQTIEPPAAAFEPISPNRPVMLTTILFLGLGLAGAVAWLMNQLNPVFHSAKQLEGVTGLSVLASVSRTWLDRHRQMRRSELMRFSGVAMMLVVLFGLVIALQRTGGEHLRQLLG
jgi:polysaccharide chain length determinant protein (PEP-CTERM system associated)